MARYAMANVFLSLFYGLPGCEGVGEYRFSCVVFRCPANKEGKCSDLTREQQRRNILFILFIFGGNFEWEELCNLTMM